jgi:hypothetical protein
MFMHCPHCVVQIESRIVGLRSDVSGSNVEIRKRIASLEHELADLKQRAK